MTRNNPADFERCEKEEELADMQKRLTVLETWRNYVAEKGDVKELANSLTWNKYLTSGAIVVIALDIVLRILRG